MMVLVWRAVRACALWSLTVLIRNQSVIVFERCEMTGVPICIFRGRAVRVEDHFGRMVVLAQSRVLGDKVRLPLADAESSKTHKALVWSY
jgi:hypothetical protein